MSNPRPAPRPTTSHLSDSLPPNRSRAVRYDDDHLLVGLGCRSPQLVGPLGESQMREVIGLGALTRAQWVAAFRRMDPRITTALHRAVTSTMPADLAGLRFAVHGVGSVAAAVDDLLPRLGGVRSEHRPEFSVTVGPPGGRVGDGDLQLLVELASDQVVVGPLLRPHAGPCARCLNLRRQDADRHWAAVRPQVLGQGMYDDEPPTAAELAHVAVGLVGLVARGVGTGHPLPVGAAMSIGTPEGVLRHHLWPVHPRCGCRELGLATA